MKQIIWLVLAIASMVSLPESGSLYAQPQAMQAADRLSGFELRRELARQSVFSALEPVSIGPSIFSCRVTDVDVNPADPTEFYVAYASGGLWYTKNNGTTFTPVFDQEASMTIGDVAVDWKRRTLWVGTGEANSSRSSYAGTGIYRSADGGKTWENRGLPESHHIARVLVHPENPDIIWVAVLGHLYTPNMERGIYRSSDGGKNWEQSLFVSDVAGGIDLCFDPNDFNTLYAATWEKERKAWNFSGAGAGSGIWKTTDGGQQWQQMNTEESGFPNGKNTGRIGICAGRKAGKTVLYASVDNQNPKPKKDEKPTEGLQKDELRTISREDFLKIEDEKLDDFLKKNEFPEKYSSAKVKDLVRKNKIAPLALVEYLEDANSSLFETNYIGAEVYRSDDGGVHWTRTHEKPLNGINFTYGYYFSTVYCLPENADKVYLLGYLIITSDDGGKTWKSINGDNVHVDHHALWVNPARPGHLLNGNDGGLNLSWDDGASWIKANSPAVGQFYAIAVDNDKPYNVYGGAQDNGVWTGSSDYTASTEWHQTGQYHYKELLGGDGMQIAVDTRDNNLVYTGYQFGNYFRINKSSGRRKYITPKHELGERPLRFNWQTPILLSKHNQDILYLGANKLYRSFDKGDNWDAISGDLTAGGAKGNVPYGTLTTISESPLRFGLLYTGSDDGVVQLTRDGGETWTRISDSLPQQLWVSRVQASSHEKSRVYVALNGYRWDDFTAYLFVSDNYGAGWKRLGAGLPAEPVNVLREDPVNPDLLYVGTDHGLYISLDRGANFERLDAGLPAVPVHDLAIATDAAELVIGTHGRSMYKMSVEQLQQLTAEVRMKDIHLFGLPKQKYSAAWGRVPDWSDTIVPVLPVMLYVARAGEVQWTVKTKSGLELYAGSSNCVKGLNKIKYSMEMAEKSLKAYEKSLSGADKNAKKTTDIKKADNGQYYLYKGTYIFEVAKDGKTTVQEFIID